MTEQRLRAALQLARARLLAEMRPEGFWEGRLSSSALATATAVSAMCVVGEGRDRPLIARGCAWLCSTQNPDGGWGDTLDSPSNLSTTLLCLSALTLAEDDHGAEPYGGTLAEDDHGAEPYGGAEPYAPSGTEGAGATRPLPGSAPTAVPPLRNGGGQPIPAGGRDWRGEAATHALDPIPPSCKEGGPGGEATDTPALGRAFDPTISLAHAYTASHHAGTPADRVAAIAAIYGADRTFAVPILVNCALAGLAPWDDIPELPFELAALPHRLHSALRLQVVSYALPALVAMGTLLHVKSPSRSPLRRALRERLRARAARVMAAMQPSHGGFLEATPLTAFVAMSMAAAVGPDHSVVQRCLCFLRDSIREDGSWPIDTNLSVWVTSNALGALVVSGGVPPHAADRALPWLLDRRYRCEHPFTHAAPGGWGWTHLEGGVPDADDTSGALRVLLALGERSALRPARRWLVGLQNADGGWPTFCRGWGKLPFDRSCPDITAHALLALRAAEAPASLTRRALRYLARTQRPDGSWTPLWFGNQRVEGHENPVFGTARVLQALAEIAPDRPMARRGLDYLVAARHEVGAWGGAPGIAPTVEETARAVVALAGWSHVPRARAALFRGAEWLAERVQDGTWVRPSPIGLYFASLWYSEAMYPLAWTVEALGVALKQNPEAGSVVNS